MKKSVLMKIRQIMALIGVIVIVLLYLSTLVFAFIDKSQSKSLMMASIFATFFVAFVLYALSLALKMIKKDETDNDKSSK